MNTRLVYDQQIKSDFFLIPLNCCKNYYGFLLVNKFFFSPTVSNTDVITPMRYACGLRVFLQGKIKMVRTAICSKKIVISVVYICNKCRISQRLSVVWLRWWFHERISFDETPGLFCWHSNSTKARIYQFLWCTRFFLVKFLPIFILHYEGKITFPS